jgi:hypothetical protein
MKLKELVVIAIIHVVFGISATQLLYFLDMVIAYLFHRMSRARVNTSIRS